jgi:hypothetical protein
MYMITYTCHLKVFNREYKITKKNNENFILIASEIKLNCVLY